MLYEVITIRINVSYWENMKNKIKVFRAMHDLTQDMLAKELNVTRQTIIAIEKEKYDLV